jgi:hypothetical protein
VAAAGSANPLGADRRPLHAEAFWNLAGTGEWGSVRPCSKMSSTSAVERVDPQLHDGMQQHLAAR